MADRSAASAQGVGHDQIQGWTSHRQPGKGFDQAVLRRFHSEILRLWRRLKHRVPRPVPVNRTWALGLIGRAGLTGRQHLILGLLDHGSRACLQMRALLLMLRVETYLT